MSQTTNHAGDQLTVLLLHGAFADASSWADVAEQLQADGVEVVVPANPLRGISIDSAYVASYLGQIPGPVLAVGHSYGGAVLSNAATNAPNVVGLVFVAAFAPDEGEILIEVEGTSKDSVLADALVPLQYPTGQGSRDRGRVRHQSRQVPRRLRRRPARGADSGDGRHAAARRRVGVLRAVRRRPPGRTSRAGASSRPVTRPPAPMSSVRWPTRAGATITEVQGSHVVMISQPQAVTDVILKAIAGGQLAATLVRDVRRD